MMSGWLVLASAVPVYAQGAKPAEPAKPAAAAAKPADKPADKPAAAAPADKPADKPAKPLTEFQKKEAAKKAFKSGEEKFDKGEYEAALALYKEADELVPGVTPKHKAALSLDKLNRVVDAVAAYQIYLDAKPDPVKYKDNIAAAEARIAELKKTPAKIKVVTVPPEIPGLKITVDGAPATGNELSLTPGKHTITASGDNFETATEDVDANFAESRDLTLTLTKKPEPVAVVPPPPPPVVEPPKPPEPAAPPPAPRSKVPAYVTLGLAGAGLVAGTVTGVLALSAKGAFNDDPTTENADKTDRMALMSDMFFAVGLTFGVTGAVLLFSKDEAAEKPAASRTIIAPWASPTGGGAVARFHF
jgi:tetratricopeptide (TPR) repeat protein